jgi:hypothetical protein
MSKESITFDRLQEHCKAQLRALQLDRLQVNVALGSYRDRA